MVTGVRIVHVRFYSHSSANRNAWHTEPTEAATSRQAGTDFNFEELAALKPQVIFDSKDTLRDKAAEVGIPVVNCLFTTFDEMKKSIELYATVFGGNAPRTVTRQP